MVEPNKKYTDERNRYMKLQFLFVVMICTLFANLSAINVWPGKYRDRPDSKEDEGVLAEVLNERYALQTKMSNYAWALVFPMQQAYDDRHKASRKEAGESARVEQEARAACEKLEQEKKFSAKTSVESVSEPLKNQIVKKALWQRISSGRNRVVAREVTVSAFGAASGGANEMSQNLEPLPVGGEDEYAETKTDVLQAAHSVVSRWTEELHSNGTSWKRGNNVLDGIVVVREDTPTFECVTPADYVLKIIIENFVEQCFCVDFPRDPMYGKGWHKSLDSSACVSGNIREILGFWFAKDWLERKKVIDDFCQKYPQAMLSVEFAVSVQGAFDEDVRAMSPLIDELQIVVTRVWAKDGAGEIISQTPTLDDLDHRRSGRKPLLSICEFETLFHINMNRK